jgi:hypothetical protein
MHEGLRLLAQLPGAASSLNAEQMMQLLQDSVQKDDHNMTAELCGVQSLKEIAQSLKPHQVAQLLTTAVKHGKSLESVFPLCKLPAALQLPAACIRRLIDSAEGTLSGIRKALERKKAAEADECVSKMMSSTPWTEYSPKRAAGMLTPSQVARQTVAAVTGAAESKHRAPPRVQLGVRVVTALQDLQAAAVVLGS